MSNLDHFYLVVGGTLLMAGGLFLGYGVVHRQEVAATSCATKGGIVIRTISGYECVKLEVIK